MNDAKIINPNKFTVSMPGIQLPRCLSAVEQIPTIGRMLSRIEQAREDAVVKCLAQFGMSMQDPEEIRRRCMVSVFPHLGVEQLHVDGVLRLEWGYLYPTNAPRTWTVRTVEPEEKK